MRVAYHQYRLVYEGVMKECPLYLCTDYLILSGYPKLQTLATFILYPPSRKGKVAQHVDRVSQSLREKNAARFLPEEPWQDGPLAAPSLREGAPRQ